MNSKNEIKPNPMLYISFNQDNSFFSIGTEEGFLIYQTNPFKGPYEKKMGAGIGIVEMVDNSNFLALMGGGEIPKYNKNKVVIWDDNENKAIAELKFLTTVLRTKYVKDYLFVICQKKIYIFDFNTYELFDNIDTSNNTRELFATNQTANPLIIAYPASKEENIITIKNYLTRQPHSFKVQDDSISKISMNSNGTLLASANEHGTIIKIHSCSDGAFLQEFKRGIEKAKINSICFDNDTKFMAVSSSRGTIHIFSMGSAFKNLKEHELNKKKEEKNENKEEHKNKKEKKEKKDKKNKKNEESKEDEKNEEKKENKKEKENKIENEKNENKTNDKKNNDNENKINDEINENKTETDNTEENKTENDKINENENKIKDNDKKEKETETEKEDEFEIIYKEKKINKNESEEITETPEEEELPQNSKTFFGGIFGSKTEKSFTQIRLKSQESICAFIKSDLIAVVTSDNKYYQYEINLKNRGEYKEICKEDLIKNK